MVASPSPSLGMSRQRTNKTPTSCSPGRVVHCCWQDEEMRRTVAMAMDGTCLGRTLWSSSATTRPARWRVFKQLAAAGRLVGSPSLALLRPWRQEITPCRTLKSITDRTRVLAADSRVRLYDDNARLVRSSGGPWRASSAKRKLRGRHRMMM